MQRFICRLNDHIICYFGNFIEVVLNIFEKEGPEIKMNHISII
jgi:hypothetical protein